MRQYRLTACITVGAASLASVLPRAISAQATYGVVELGAARLDQPTLPTTHALMAGLTLRHDARRYTVAGTGGLTLAGDGRSTSQAMVTGSLLARPGRATRWEIGGTLTGFDQGAGSFTGGAYVIAREHVVLGRSGGWVGVAIGGVRDADVWSPTRTAEVGSWFGNRATRLTATAVLVDTRSEGYPRDGIDVTDPITYTDAAVGVRWSFRNRIDLDTRGGLRLISRGALTATGRGTRSFASVDATLWVMPRLALAVAVGRQLSDLPRGIPDTRFATIALRFAMRDRLAPRPPPTRRPMPSVLRLTLLPDSVGYSRVIVTSPTEGTIEMAASFTNWEPVVLVRRGDVWELDRPVSSGAHRVLVRVNGGAWFVPPNLPAAADDFGGTVGILTVP